VEIGGGYGGLCFYLHSLAPLFNITIVSYTIFDLPDICTLQLKYTEALGISVSTHTLDSAWDVNPNSFLVSTYAFSELPAELRSAYSEKVLSNVFHGFIAWNNIPLYDFVNTTIKSEPERPLTGPNNLFVWF
jgi:hypothetical protein